MSDAVHRYAWCSIAASVLTLGLKFWAWDMTGSVGLLSDALESLVNLTAGLLALWALLVAGRPADQGHAYGHGKAEYFAGAVEGLLILVAAGGIVLAAWGRFRNPVGLESLGPGLVVSLAASAVNFGAARILLSAARRFDSIALEADARHLITDVWTSGGMVAGLSVVLVRPDWAVIDPVIGGIMGLNIVFTGLSLIRRSLDGLMDAGLPEAEVEAVVRAIKKAAGEGVTYHGLRTRKAGRRRFADFHLLVPGAMTVKASHDLCCDIEEAIRGDLKDIQVTIHVEPKEDAASQDGDRVGGRCPQDGPGSRADRG